MTGIGPEKGVQKADAVVRPEHTMDLPANEASGDVFLLTHSKSSSIEGLLYSPNTVINHHY